MPERRQDSGAWGTTLDRAQKAVYEAFVAALAEVPADMTMREAASALYAAALQAGCPKVTEVDGGGC